MAGHFSQYTFEILYLVHNSPAEWSAETLLPLSTPAPKLVVRQHGPVLGRFVFAKTQARWGLIPLLAVGSLATERMTSGCSKYH